MKKLALVAAALVAVTLAVVFVVIPRARATQGAEHERKGPRVIPAVRSEVPGLVIVNPRFEGGDDSVIVYDVANNTAQPVRQFLITATKGRDEIGEGFTSLNADGDLKPSASITRRTPTDNLPQGAALVIVGALFEDGSEPGSPDVVARMDHYRALLRKEGQLKRPDPQR